MRITKINSDVNFKAKFIPLNQSSELGEEFYQLLAKKAASVGKSDSVITMEDNVNTANIFPELPDLEYSQRVVDLSYFEKEQAVPNLMIRVTDSKKTFDKFKDAIFNAIDKIARSSIWLSPLMKKPKGFLAS